MDGQRKKAGPKGWGQRLRAAQFARISSLCLLLSFTSAHSPGDAEVQALHRAQAHRIYSVLKSHGVDLGDGTAWRVAVTIASESRRHSLDPELILGVIRVESSFRRRAVSSAGARGLMQIRPFVADALAEDLGFEKWKGIESLDDPVTNVKLGVFYLAHLKQRFGDLKLALSAYRWGPTRVQNRLEAAQSVPRGYARRVIKFAALYRRQQPSYFTVGASENKGSLFWF
jgi:soluble lytic murein transglycosylase-like protein